MIRLRKWHEVFLATSFAVAAALFSLVMPPFAPVDSQSSFSTEYNTDRGGGDYKNFAMSQTNHEVCRDYCAADSNCKAYTYVKPYQGNPAHCWLKSTVPNPVPDRDCCISGVRGGSSGGGGGDSWGPVNDQAGLDGTRLTFYLGTTAQQCQADCDKNPNCRGFTLIRAGAYGPNDPPMCYLMSEVKAFTPSTCCISAIKGGGGSGGGGGGNNVSNFIGDWNTVIDGFAFSMSLKQGGNRVTGDIDGNRGTIEGTVTGRTLRFRWTYSGSKGSGHYVLSDDGRTFKGFFSETDDPENRSRGFWNGTKR